MRCVYRGGESAYRLRRLCLLMAMLTLLTAVLSACSSEVRLTLLPHEVTVKENTATIQVSVRNDGTAIEFQGSESSVFGEAELTDAAGKVYQNPGPSVFDTAYNYMCYGDVYSKSYTFRNLTESGYYTLTFWCVGYQFTIEDIYIELPQ